jgi:hypothetical protein
MALAPMSRRLLRGKLSVRDRTGAELRMSGMAPRAKLYGFKVLDNQGTATIPSS